VAEVAWAAPGPGHWVLELSHFGGKFTPLYAAVYAPGQNGGMATAMERYGLAARTFEIRYVNHRPYTRIVPLFEPPGRLASKQPPGAMVWVLSRVHPAFRRRRTAAVRAFAAKAWEEDARRWAALKPALIEAQLALQDEPIESLDAPALAGHVERACANVADGVRIHFELAAASGAPVGDLVMACRSWGFTDAEAVSLLAGASPASAETAAWARQHTPDDYLRRFGCRVVTSYDIDGTTLGEMPGLVTGAFEQARHGAAPVDSGARTASLRDRVPATERARFDELVGDARTGYGVRDDNAGVTLQWTAGLLRRAALEAGRRLVAAGRLDAPEHTFELQPSELRALILGAPEPSREDVTARAADRARLTALDAPAGLGPDEPLPPFEKLPKPLARMAMTMVVAFELMNTAPQQEELCGTGVGTGVVKGVARVATTPDDAIARLQPGDVLVAPFTTPAYNAVLPIVGALVVEEGGALSHAAIVARELAIPAVIGAVRAVQLIPDGAEVEVDPQAGRVRVL
jgi:phosphohistidine swiveling domain-containing protein